MREYAEDQITVSESKPFPSRTPIISNVLIENHYCYVEVSLGNSGEQHRGFQRFSSFNVFRLENLLHVHFLSSSRNDKKAGNVSRLLPLVELVLLDRGDDRRLVVELDHKRRSRTFDLGGPGGTDGQNVEAVLFQETGNRRLDLVGVIGTTLQPDDGGVGLFRAAENRPFHLVRVRGGLHLARHALRLLGLLRLFRLGGSLRDRTPLHQRREILPNLIDDGVAGIFGRVVHERAHPAVRQRLGDGAHDLGVRGGLTGGLRLGGHGVVLSFGFM